MSIWSIITAIIVFGVIVFVHELGHYLAAKWAKIKINEFAIGMGPTLFSFEKKEIKYSLRAFPIGGFLAMEGENDESEDTNAFCNTSVFKRIVVILAGAAMNLLLGLIILGFLSSQQALFGTTQIANFADDAVSSQVLQAGDTITRVNGNKVRTSNDLVYEFMRSRDGNMDIVVNRNGEALPVNVQFRMDTPPEDTSVQIIYLDFKVVGLEPTFLNTIGNTFNWTASIVKQVWGSFVDLVTGRFGFSQLSGPVGVTKAIGQASSAGYESLLLLVSFITVNLGVFNLLPLPALDGGRFIFLLIEAIRRKPLNARYEGAVNAAGFILLIGLMIIVTFNDVFKLFAQ